MRFYITICFTFFTLIAFSQLVNIDFENTNSSDFINFDGGMASVIDNPFKELENKSNKVAQIIRNGGQIWAGSKLILDAPIDFTENSILAMKVYTSAPIGTIIKFKLEGNGQAETDVKTTKKNEWESLQWDFTGQPTQFTELVFMFDFGNVGNGGINSTFLFDEVQQIYGGKQIDFPVNFDEADINYTVTDFGGNQSKLVADPVNPSNNVIMTVKTANAATWAGTTIGTPAGFKTNIPITLQNSKMHARVFSPDAGIPVRLKIEDHADPTHTCETQTNTTIAGGWELIEFDFLNQAPGTELLSVGLDKGWTYNMASIFFNFDTDGATAGEKTYYFDDVYFDKLVYNEFVNLDISVNFFPNPAKNSLNISLEDLEINAYIIYNLTGQTIEQKIVQSNKIVLDVSQYENGLYFISLMTEKGQVIQKFIKE